MKKKNKTWTDNLVQYIKNKNPGICPKCGSKNIAISEYNINNHTSLNFRCEDCGAAAHIDGKK